MKGESIVFPTHFYHTTQFFSKVSRDNDDDQDEEKHQARAVSGRRGGRKPVRCKVGDAWILYIITCFASTKPSWKYAWHADFGMYSLFVTGHELSLSDLQAVFLFIWWWLCSIQLVCRRKNRRRRKDRCTYSDEIMVVAFSFLFSPTD